MSHRIVVSIFLLIMVSAAIWYFSSQSDEEQNAGGGKPLVDVAVPTLSSKAKLGQRLFDANCAICHGSNASGVAGIGPPLVHKIYESSHHGDGAFFMAVQHGVRAHHWPFGNMPAVAGVTVKDVEKIVAYVRELQRANGIY